MQFFKRTRVSTAVRTAHYQWFWFWSKCVRCRLYCEMEKVYKWPLFYLIPKTLRLTLALRLSPKSDVVQHYVKVWRVNDVHEIYISLSFSIGTYAFNRRFTGAFKLNSCACGCLWYDFKSNSTRIIQYIITIRNEDSRRTNNCKFSIDFTINSNIDRTIR